ncbi:MAG: 23S rRNA (guanosine(2251)-2'-O)-methyltransferase RlmB [Actinomycetota bacterium]
MEGRQAVRELLLAGKRPINEVLMIDDLADAEVLADIEELSHEFGVSFRRVSRRHLGSEALTESHQGVIAKAAPLGEADFDVLKADPNAFILVLDGITDPGNLGAILRTAECAGVSGVVLGRHRSVHISPTVTKTAAGAVEHVPMTLVGGIPTALAQLNDAGVFTVGLDGGGDRSIFDLPQLGEGPVALVLGAEGPGLSRLVRQRVQAMASIPLSGELNSLNVATATAVACFEVVRARGGSADGGL